MRCDRRIAIGIVLVALAAAFVLFNSGLDLDYVIPKRLNRLAAMFIGGICVAVSSILFQTIAGNRILTPAIMGYEAVYLLLQSLLILAMGVQSLMVVDRNANYVLSILVMLAYSWAIHRWLFRRGKNDVFFLLLVGLVLSIVINTFTQFIQLRISPGEFSIFQGLALASFERINTESLLYAAVPVAVVCVLVWRQLPFFDVIALGRDQAISLGVDYPSKVRLYLALIAILVAVSTSLIGPTAFMGIFVANIAYAVARSPRHRVTLPMGSAIATGVFIVAQLLVEHVFNYKTTIGILINLVCGGYFLMLMVRTRKAA